MVRSTSEGRLGTKLRALAGIGQPLTEEQRKPLLDSLGRLDDQTLFSVLTPHVRNRAVLYTTELEIPGHTIERLRPWAAYYIYAAAFDWKHGYRQAAAGVTPPAPPDMVLLRQALSERKTLCAELTMEQVYRRMAAMPDKVQDDYLSWLFDYFDDELHRRNRDRFDWMPGRLASRSIERMRNRIYPERTKLWMANAIKWWAQKIGDLLTAGNNAFIAIGQNHFADSQGILTLLKRRKIARRGVTGAFLRHPQVPAATAAHAIRSEHMALPFEEDSNRPVTIARILGRQRPHGGNDGRIPRDQPRHVPQRGPRDRE